MITQTVFAALSLLLAARADQRDVLFQALADELQRNQQQLALDDHGAPYYIGYRLVERESVVVEARFGAIVDDEREVARRAAVDVRVGDYTFDSAPEPDDTTMLFEDLTGFRPRKEAPVDDDPGALRATFWLLTDAAYKGALSTYLRKQARKVTTVEDKHVDSFSREKPVQRVDPPMRLDADAEAWRGQARRLSARFRTAGRLLDGSVRISGERTRTYIVTSEGSRVLKEHVIYSLAFDATSQAEDGALLEQGETFYASAPEKLPTEAQLDALVTRALTNLEALAKAPIADPYTGPAILEPEATGVFFHETIGHRLEGERQNDDNEGRTFKGQVGQPIIPAFLTVRDDPTQPAFAGTPLNGHYLIDDQGVPAQNTVLVDKGVLKTFLTSRTPIEDVKLSNGHGRAQGVATPMARMGNLFVESSRKVPRAELKAMLLAEVKKQGKPYGLIIRDITGGSTNTSNYGYQAFKGTPRMVYRVDAATGEETLVRGVEMVGTPLTVISKILTASEEMGIFNGYCGAESGYVPVSAIAPATLFSEIELQRSQRDKERPPLLTPLGRQAVKPVALRAAGLTDTGSVREHNEDAFLVAGNLLVVADGMGGHRAGEVAARICVEELGALFEPAEGPRPWWRFWGPGLGGQARLADALRRANRAIFDASRGAPEHQGMGTTVVALWRDGPTLHYAHVGDSRLYRLRDGTLTQLTADHSLLERCKRAGLVDAADDADFPYKNVIVRALGLQPGVIVDAASTPVAPGDRYLLCSDGLTDLLDGRTIQARLAADASPSEVALGLVQDALEAGGVDNVTVVVAHLEPGEP